jgi:hypothetical protein
VTTAPAQVSGADRRAPGRRPARALTPAILGVMIGLSVVLTPSPALGQADVSRTEGAFLLTLTVDKLVYALFDTVHVVYTVENTSDTTAWFPLCCCGVEFFAVRDSSCTLEDEDCQVAGCDACETCFPDNDCSFDPCIPFPLAPGQSQTFVWDWDRVLCPLDAGYDETYGNVGTYRIEVGYRDCADGALRGRLSIPIEILTQVPVRRSTWGGMKANPPGRPPRR